MSAAIKTCPTCGSEYPLSERFCPRDGTALRSQNPEGDLVGSVIAERYHVMKKLGEGGMGTVYLAEHVKMGRKSALKVMNPGMSQDADAIARFNREASNASRLNHPNVCAIYDFGETPDGLIYLAMEFIEGESLTSIIEKSGQLPPGRAASILHQAADGLQVAHDSGIVHRDLKPDNIMIAKGRDGADLVKVVDFGIAKAHTSDAQKVTKTGLVVGTPEYMSPEQLAGDKLDGRSDIYSLALVGFNMLTGTLPFPSTSAQESMIMRLTDNPRPLSAMKPDVAWPEGLQQVMDKALARDVNQRYAKASDFGREFSMAIEAMPSKAMTEARTQVVGSMRATPNAPTQQIPQTHVASASPEAPPPAIAPTIAPAPTPVAKRGMGMMIGGGVVVVGVIIGAYLMLNKPDAGTGAANPAGGTNPPIAAGGDTTGRGGAGGAGDGKQLAGGGAGRGAQQFQKPVDSVRGGDAGRATGGRSDQPPAQTVTEADLANLETWTAAANTADAAKAQQLATQLLGKIISDSMRTVVLYRRAKARIILNDDAGVCQDLKEAQRIGKAFTRAINGMIESNACPPSPGGYSHE